MAPQSVPVDKDLKREKQGACVAYLLALVAGAVDAIGYIALFHMFTAHMSGNSAGLGAELGQGHSGRILHHLFPIPMFMIGVLCGSVIIEISKRRNFRRYLSVVLSLEALLIALFMCFGGRSFLTGGMQILSPHFYAIAALPALAMGIQTASLHKLGSTAIRTTFVTGMITLFCKELVNYLLWLNRSRGMSLRALAAASSHQISFIRMILSGGIWFFYMMGAVLGGFLMVRIQLWSLTLPLGLMVIAISIDWHEWQGQEPGTE